jgi:nitrogenase molybdenum-iron protein alpha/beta subunit
MLERLGVKDSNYDAIIYDVLGDVVCGGFAVPIRREYADKVYVVTSGEFMSLYAANNILRGLNNYDADAPRAGGIIFNARGGQEESGRVRRFSEAVNLPILEEIPRDKQFALSEAESMCLVERFPDSDIAKQFSRLAGFIATQEKLYQANPLTDEDLEEIVLEKKPATRIHSGHGTLDIGNIETGDLEASGDPSVPNELEQKNRHLSQMNFSKSLIAKEPLHGCAFSGALSICTQLGDCISIVHGPVSCAHIAYQALTSLSRRFLLERGIVLPMQTAPSVLCTEMNEGVMIFGGAEELKNKIIEAKAAGPKAIFALTTCPSGIIGENTDFVPAMSDQDTTVIPILTEGNIAGDYLQGILMAYAQIAKQIIKRDLPVIPNTVNIISEKSIANATGDNLGYIKDILDAMGVRINCRFICESSYEQVQGFMSAPLNLLAHEDYMGRSIRDFMVSEFNAEFFSRPFPIGFSQSCIWVQELGAYFGKQALADQIIEDHKKRYFAQIEQIKPFLKGKRLMMLTFNHKPDWILETAIDLEMEVAFVGIMNFSQDNLFETQFENQISELKLAYDPMDRKTDIQRIQPDILLNNYSFVDVNDEMINDNIPLTPDAGFFSGITMARRWSELFKMDLKEGWKQDESLYRKYFA